MKVKEKTSKPRKRRNIPHPKPKYPAMRALMRDVAKFMDTWQDPDRLDEEDIEMAEFISRIVQWDSNKND
jgi:hypothetical protein